MTVDNFDFVFDISLLCFDFLLQGDVDCFDIVTLTM